MDIEYRIKKQGENYWPHVRRRLTVGYFGYWEDWRKVVMFGDIVYFLELPDDSYPKTKPECEEIIKHVNDRLKIAVKQDKETVYIPYKVE
jgi:hypothetical protein